MHKTRFLKEDLIKPSNHAYLQWNNVNYYVPRNKTNILMSDKIGSQD